MDQTPAFVNFDIIKEMFFAEQILAAFGISVDNSGLTCCPFHADSTPSMQVNKNWVYCHSCKRAWDNFALAKGLLEKSGKLSAGVVFAWFQTTRFSAVKHEYTTTKTPYIGAVAPSLIEYWHSSLTPEHYEKLLSERLFTPETVDKHMLGWRPRREEWSIPFFRGTTGTSEVDIVQFRTTKPDSRVKYYGLEGHNRGSVMNAEILLQNLPFLVVFFGSFDAILARQDGLPAVGLTGANPFHRDEDERVRELFENQHSIFVVPDNTPAEFEPAQKFAELVGGQVRFFNPELPADTDYISYRKTHNSFIEDVLNIKPSTPIPQELTSSIFDLLAGGDPAGAVPMHIQAHARGIPAQDIAFSLAHNARPSSLSGAQWGNVQSKLWRVRTEAELKQALALWKDAYYTTKGSW